MDEYKRSERERRITARKALKEAQIKKLYDVKDKVDEQLERMVGGPKNLDS